MTKPKRSSIADARANLPQLIRDAEAGKTIELTRRGDGVAVLIGWKNYERLTSQLRPFAEAFDDFRRSVALAELDIDPDEVFGDVRDPDPGRDPSL
jgi:prevent-host-death family protein